MAGAINYVATVSSTANASSYTFTDASIGTAASDRIVCVVVAYRSAGNVTVSSVTIGGNAATAAAECQNFSTNTGFCGIYYLAVASGTTANIVVSLSGTAARCCVDVYEATGINSTPHATGTDISSPYSISLDIPAEGVALGGFQAAATATVNWTNLTERADTQVESAMQAASASDNFATQQTGLAISVSSGSNDLPAFAVVSWGPATGGAGVVGPLTFGRLTGGGILAGGRLIR